MMDCSQVVCHFASSQQVWGSSHAHAEGMQLVDSVTCVLGFMEVPAQLGFSATIEPFLAQASDKVTIGKKCPNMVAVLKHSGLFWTLPVGAAFS